MPFPIYPFQTDRHLATWLPADQRSRIVAAVTNALASGDADEDVQTVAGELRVAPIQLAEYEFEDVPWLRRMRAGADDFSGVLRGIRPGASYTVQYDQYNLPVISGARMIAVGANGGAMLDPDFVSYSSGRIRIRAASDDHRAQLVGEIEAHVDRANAIIAAWNIDQLPTAIRAEYRRQLSTAEAGTARRAAKLGAGFRPAPRSVGRAPVPVPLADTKYQGSRRPPRADLVDLTYVLTGDQFERILDCMAAHRDQVERLPGAGADPSAAEDDHRDRLLAALNLRFTDGTAESFSCRGRTDIRLVVEAHSYFYAECKIWDGPASVDEAIDQLLGRYLNPRDRFSAIVLFVRNRKSPGDVISSASARLEQQHGGTRVDDASGFPVMAVPVPGHDGRSVDVAVVTIIVDAALPRSR